MAGHGCQQGFQLVASFGFGGQESASKPPQAIRKPLKVQINDSENEQSLKIQQYV